MGMRRWACEPSVRGAAAHPRGSSTSRTTGLRRRCTLSPVRAPLPCANPQAGSRLGRSPADETQSSIRGPPSREENRTRPGNRCTSAHHLYHLQPRGAPRKRSLLRTRNPAVGLPSGRRIWTRVASSLRGKRPARVTRRQAPSVSAGGLCFTASGHSEPSAQSTRSLGGIDR